MALVVSQSLGPYLKLYTSGPCPTHLLGKALKVLEGRECEQTCRNVVEEASHKVDVVSRGRHSREEEFVMIADVRRILKQQKEEFENYHGG